MLAIPLSLFPLLLTLPLQTDHAIQLLTLLPALVVLLWDRRAPSPLPSRTVRLLLVAILIGASLSTFYSPQPARSAVALAGFLWTASSVWIAWRLSTNSNAVRLLLASITLGAVVGLVALKIGLETQAEGFPFYSHPRIFGMHMFAGAIAAFGWLLIEHTSKAWRVTAMSFALLVWAGLAWSGSRAPVLGLAVALGLGFCFQSCGAERRRFLTRTALLSIGSLLLALLLGSPRAHMGWWTALRRTANASDLDALSSKRIQIWEIVWTKIQTAPWLGHGGDAYLFIHPRLGGDQPHNFILQWMHEWGLVSTLPLLALLAWCLSCALRKDVSPPGISPIRRWAGASLAGATVCALFDGVFYHVIIALPIFLIAGLCIPPGSTLRAKSQALGRRLPIVALSATALTLLLHNGLALALQYAQPATPQAPVARLLKVFPSNTFGLWRWLGAWEREQPNAVLHWAHWAQDHAISPALFHLYAAQWHANRGERQKALNEIEQGLAKADRTSKPILEELRQAILAPPS